jgi:hypothetical protein
VFTGFVRHKASDVIADELMAKLLEHLQFEELLENAQKAKGVRPFSLNCLPRPAPTVGQLANCPTMPLPCALPAAC